MLAKSIPLAQSFLGVRFLAQRVTADAKFATVVLESGESLAARRGALVFADGGDVRVSASTLGAGFLGSAARMVGGEPLFVPTITNVGATASRVTFAAPIPASTLSEIEVSPNRDVLFNERAFIAAPTAVRLGASLQRRFSVGLTGVGSFILQRLRSDSPAAALVMGGGSVIRRQLAVGESIKADAACVLGFCSTVDLDLELVSGIRGALFGGHGLLLARLTGPGLVMLQTQPFSRFARRIVRAAKAAEPAPPPPPPQHIVVHSANGASPI